MRYVNEGKLFIIVHNLQRFDFIDFDYLKFAFKEGMKQGLSNDNVLMFDQEAAIIKPEAALEWLIERGGRWDKKRDSSFYSKRQKLNLV